MKRWKITIEYKGTDYAGWQRQKDVPSVQGAIERALKKFCQKNIEIYAAGRTDAGVHARGQVAHFDLEYGDRALTGYNLAKAINAHLRPQAISVIKAEEIQYEKSENPDEVFHARFSAKNKLYLYRIINRPGFLAIEQGLAWQIKQPLDTKAMHDAAQILIGKHDFSSFRDAQCQSRSPVKTLDRLDITTRAYDECGGMEILFEAEGLSFLHHQVRNIVGTLTLIGKEKWTKDDLKTALAAKNRQKAGPTAPADGLYLMRVDY